ncbi:CBF/Mak21 family-domain-containing protein [Boletus edulis BED1]|uniref:CBF/Mak21 family-domain-containing protein n=1 Tax=Boletus edulis BED1 TaxID=1328754 RepID=A0AAD4G918_BOLED|nr:CBF/Mak21 family-domain-containing protein [Boletus edulis BED1]
MTTTKPHSKDSVTGLFDRALALHAQAVLSFKSSSTATSSKSEYAFLQKILQSGTLSDRLSALTLLVQSSPLHNTKALDALRSLAERGKGSGGRGESLKALRCIVDWWVGGGAPDRKLKYFRDQPLTNRNIDDEQLIAWYFEDWLKKYLFSILQILENLAADPLPYVRTQALSLISNLLLNKPEQEHNLLKLLVNKLGDGEKQICSRASYHILQVLQMHPLMKTVVIRELTPLIFAPVSAPTSASGGKNMANEHARYYAAITLNQIFLQPRDTDVALQLIDVYFRMFEDLLNEGKVAEDEEDAHGKLISAILTGVNRALPFAKLDATAESFHKHTDTLFHITHTSTFNISLQSLVLIQHLSSSLASRPGSSSRSRSIVDRYYSALYSSLHDARLTSSSKQTMYLNLLFKSLKTDNNPGRVKSFVRRFVQVLVGGGAGGTEFVVGGLYLLGEMFTTIPGLRELLQDMSTPLTAEDYDPRKRDPQFAHASASPLYELLPLLHHYHPTVALHARQLLASQPITSSPDLTLNTLSHFLDRFVYKNPKKTKSKGASAMQPAASAADGIAVKRLKGEASGGALPNEDTFWKKKEDEVPVDEAFFHKYFTRKICGQVSQNESREKEGSQGFREPSDEDSTDNEHEADEEGSSDTEEDAVWKTMQATMPGEEGDEAFLEEDYDIDDDELLSDPNASSNSTAEGSEGFDEGEIGDSTSFAEGSDDDDLVVVDDIPNGLIEYDGSDAETEQDREWGGISGGDKRKWNDKSQTGRKKRKTLPTFASYEEYARMIEDGPEDDV